MNAQSFLTGYIDEARVTKNVARYAAAFARRPRRFPTTDLNASTYAHRLISQRGPSGPASSLTPENVAEGDLRRRRFLLMWVIIGSLETLYLVASNIAAVRGLGRTWAELGALPANRATVAMLGLVAVVLIISRFSWPSRRALEALEIFLALAHCAVAALLSYWCPSSALPALDLGAPPSPSPASAVLSTFAVLTLRAALLPSTPRRTLTVGIAASAPSVLVAYLIHRRYLTDDALRFAIGTTVLSVAVLPVPVAISRVIYGLRAQVRAAMRLGQYTLEGKIGQGGMGVVYRARHALLRRPTAVKLLPRARAGATNLARFELEVQHTSLLSHPNTVAIYDYGHTPDGIFYYAMEYLDGLSLEEVVQHDGPQEPGRVVNILRQACGALGEAHEAGLIHRDIKPANLHLCNRGGIADHVKVLDFGLVKQIDADPALAHLSSADSFVGTPLYMAPEMIAQPDQVDGRADIYALGALAYFLLTGTPPFQGKTVMEVCGKHLHMEPESPSARLGRDLPATLERLVLACLAKRSELRPPSAAALGSALAGCHDVEAWTDAQARTWWRDRSSSILALAARRRAADLSEEGELTFAPQRSPPARASVPRGAAGR